MNYVVIKSFTDKNTKVKYLVGDRYPHRGVPGKDRIEELSTSNNKKGEPLIKVVEEGTIGKPVDDEAKSEKKTKGKKK